METIKRCDIIQLAEFYHNEGSIMNQEVMLHRIRTLLAESKRK